MNRVIRFLKKEEKETIIEIAELDTWYKHWYNNKVPFNKKMKVERRRQYLIDLQKAIKILSEAERD